MSDFTSIREQLLNQKMKVDFNSYDFSIKEIVSMIRDGIINISPEYQRHFRWKEDRQSSLVESLFLGIPVPNIFMATNAVDGSWELIDGVQRISSIINFIGNDNERKMIDGRSRGPLRIQGLTKLSEFNGKTFAELPVEIQRQFLLTIIKVTTLSDKSDKAVRFDLFERLNRGGVSLSDQEIRSCVYRGSFNDFLKRMAKDENYVSCVHISDAQEQDGTREELVLRFFAYLYDVENFVHSVKDFLSDYMEKANGNFDYEENEKLFKRVFKSLNDALPNGISRGRRNTPLNLYEGVAVGAALALKNKGRINTKGMTKWLSDEKLTKYTTGATNTKLSVEGRIDYCRSKFEGK